MNIPFLMFYLSKYLLVSVHHNQWGERCRENRERSFDRPAPHLLGKGVVAPWSSFLKQIVLVLNTENKS